MEKQTKRGGNCSGEDVADCDMCADTGWDVRKVIQGQSEHIKFLEGVIAGVMRRQDRMEALQDWHWAHVPQVPGGQRP